MRRSYVLEAYTAGMATTLALLIFGYQYANGADMIVRVCRLGFP